MLALAFVAVLGETATDLLEPWPLKIVFDYIFGTKKLPGWLSSVLHASFGVDKPGILHFADSVQNDIPKQRKFPIAIT